MKYTQEEILYALRMLKEICEEHKSCSKCPFGTADSMCLITEYTPTSYILNEEGVRVWRALL